MSPIRSLASARVSAFLLLLFLIGCGSKNDVNSNLSTSVPQKILWEWEHTGDLKFIDPNEFGVAFLAQTIFLENDRVNPRPRHQPLDVPPNTYLIAITRIETNKETTRRPKFDVAMVSKTAFLIKNTLALPNIRAVQVDFDAGITEREFYRSLMREVRRQTPEGVPLTMTSLASWCKGDAWFKDFPVDEAVPMVFQMGADSENIRTYLRNGNDWTEPLCRGSYGISLEEGRFDGMRPDRRIYYFSNNAWKTTDLPLLR